LLEALPRAYQPSLSAGRSISQRTLYAFSGEFGWAVEISAMAGAEDWFDAATKREERESTTAKLRREQLWTGWIPSSSSIPSP